MSMKTQGTQLYVLVPTTADPAVMEVIEIEKIANFNAGGSPADQIEDTGLADEARTYQKGLRTPGQATFTVYADPRNATHVKLYEMSELDENDQFKWVLGWSDGKGVAPTVATGGNDFELPATRTWFRFDGYVADFPFDFAGNAVVNTAAAIQRTGRGQWIKKTP